MNCRKVYRYICDNLDEKLDSPRCRQIRRHLDGCPECQEYLKSIKLTVKLYRAAPPPQIPAATHNRLMKVLNLELGKHGTPARKGSRACR